MYGSTPPPPGCSTTGLILYPYTSNFIFLCFHLIITHKHTQKQRKMKSKNKNTIIIEPQHMQILISVLRCGHIYDYNKMLWEHTFGR